jgi:hypothetical protein
MWRKDYIRINTVFEKNSEELGLNYVLRQKKIFTINSLASYRIWRTKMSTRNGGLDLTDHKEEIEERWKQMNEIRKEFHQQQMTLYSIGFLVA